MSCCNRSNNVMGETGRRRCCCRRDNVLGTSNIALRGPGCISGTGRCGNYTASFVESNGVFMEGYGNVIPESGSTRNCCKIPYNYRRCRNRSRSLYDYLETPITCPR